MKIGSAVPPPKAEGVKNKRPQLAIDQVFKTLRSGLKIYVERSGDGPKVVKGSQVKVHYDGWLAEDYSKFDSSRDKRRPFEFELGAGKVIKGWEEGLEGLRAGQNTAHHSGQAGLRQSRSAFDGNPRRCGTDLQG